jgi:hypothetical protein
VAIVALNRSNQNRSFLIPALAAARKIVGARFIDAITGQPVVADAQGRLRYTLGPLRASASVLAFNISDRAN